MEVLVGPTFTINVSSSPPSAYDGDHQKLAQGNEWGHRIMERPKFSAGDSSESSSSIGTPDDSGDEEEEEEVQSKLNRGLGLGSLDCLQDSLPIKRGLSGHFDGKSKSFTDLSQVNTLKELQKRENPFNKRRRVLMASKRSRRSAFYTWSNPKSMPLLPLEEDDDEEQEEEEKCRKLASPSSLSSSSSSSSTEEKKQEDQLLQLRQNRVPESYASKTRLRLGSFKSRSFSLADLQEHDDEDEDN